MGSGNHGHGHAHANQQGNQAASKADTDVDVGHDPERARKVSNAGLNREANKQADAANPDQLHDQADQAAYESLFASIDLLSNRMYGATDDVWTVIRSPEDAGGVYKKIDIVQSIYDRMTDQLATLRTSMQRQKTASYRPLGKDLTSLQNNVERFLVAVYAAQSAFANAQGGFKPDLEMPKGELKMMYDHAGLEMPATATIDRKDDPAAADTESLENAALVSAEKSIGASVKAVRARLSAPDAELKGEVGKLVGSLEEMRATLESMANPGRIHSTHKLATLIHEADGVIAELDKKPAMREYLEGTAVAYTISVLRAHLKK